MPLAITPCQVQRGEVHYWRVSKPELFSPGAFPVICRRLRTSEKQVNGQPTVFYGIPIHEYPGLMKVRLLCVFGIAKYLQNKYDYIMTIKCMCNWGWTAGCAAHTWLVKTEACQCCMVCKVLCFNISLSIQRWHWHFKSGQAQGLGILLVAKFKM